MNPGRTPIVREHTDAVIAALEVMALNVGDAVPPRDPGDVSKTVAPPYVVVYQIPGGSRMGPLGGRFEDVDLVYQVTCVGRSREQSEWLADTALQLLTTDLEIPGRKVLRVALDMNGGTGRDDDVSPPIFYSTPRFRVSTTPTSEES